MIFTAMRRQMVSRVVEYSVSAKIACTPTAGIAPIPAQATAYASLHVTLICPVKLKEKVKSAPGIAHARLLHPLGGFAG
jgi:hypothetical protein